MTIPRYVPMHQTGKIASAVSETEVSQHNKGPT